MNAEAVSAILKEGSPVSTKIGAHPAWYRNVVFKSEGNLVKLALLDRYLENVILTGSTISIKYFNEFFVYLFTGIIQNIYAGKPGYIIVQITQCEEIINTRLSPRYDIHLPSNLRPDWDNLQYFAIITDLSYGGMAFLCSHRIDCNDEVWVEAFLPSNHIFHAKGKVIRRCIKGCIIEYSMQFTEIDEENCMLLSKYFARLDAENSALYQLYLQHANKQ